MVELLVILALILFNGVLAMSEIALISVRKSYLSSEVKKGSKSAIIALRLANEPNNFLSTIQIGITIIGILTGIYSGSVLSDDFSVVLIEWGVSTYYSHFIAQTVIVVGVTYLTLIFGELVPKRIGMSVAENVVKIVARPMYVLSLVASPFVWLLSKSTTGVFDLMGLKSDLGKVTEEEIKSMIQEGTDGGEIQEVEQDILERVFMLGDLRVSSLMTHRSDIVFLDIDMKTEDIRRVLSEKLYEVYPVVSANLDNVKGVISLKELIFDLYNDDFRLADAVVPAIYFHENMSVYKVLERMKELSADQVLICDEFGTCQGIITLKDIMEGLVGTITDSDEEPEIIARKEGEGWFVDGQCSFYDFLCYFDKEHLHSNSHYHTVGGLVLELLEHIPETGESTYWKGFHFEVADMDGARIDKILVTYRSDKILTKKS